MSSVRRKQAEELFQVAVDLPIEKRAAFLDQRCDSDADLRSDVNDLLEAHDRDQDDFLAVSPFPPIEELLDMDDSVEPETEDEGTPQTLSGHYHIERELGHGGMGVVYLAHDTKLDRDVAIKMLPAGYSHDPARLTLFEREARTAGNLNHPNIGTIYEFGAHEGRHFIAMEYVEGDQLGALLQGGMPLALREFIDIAIEIAQGLTAAHDSGVVHRDLKPGNVMRTGDGRVKILDFGLAKAVQEGLPAPADLSDSKLTPEVTSALGTAGYSSPEQCRGEPADFRSDLFSFGVVLYELITGRPPFKRDSFPMTIQAVLKDEPEPPNAGLADVPPRLANLITKLLAKRPEDRCQSSAEVLTELKGIKYHLRHPYLHLRAPLVIVVCLSVLGLLLYSYWPEASRIVDNELFEGLPERLAQRDLDQARTDLRALGEQFGQEEVEGLIALVGFYEKLTTDIPAARALLDELDRDWPRKEHWMISASEALQAETADLLESLNGTLLVQLAQGSFDEARATGETIENLDPTDHVSTLWSKAENLWQETLELNESSLAAMQGTEALSGEDLWELRDKIKELEGKKLENEPFRPAIKAGEHLRGELVRRLEVTSNLSGLGPEELEDRRRLLSTLEPASDKLDVLSRMTQELYDQEKRAQLRIEAEGMRSSASELLRISIEMKGLDRVHEETAEVALLHAQSKLQESSYRDALGAFTTGGGQQLVDAIRRFESSGQDKYRVDGLEVFTGKAEQELVQLERAQLWLSELKSARDHLGADLDEARRRRTRLTDSLPSFPFAQPAREHLAELNDELATAERSAEIASLREQLDHAVKLLREDEAETALQGLARLGVDGPELENDRERVGRLNGDLETWREADEDYVDFRRHLREQRESSSTALLAVLEIRWTEESSQRSAAIEYQANLPLELKPAEAERERMYLRLAVLELRLGNSHRVLQEAHTLQTTAEGLILLAQAKFKTDPGEQSIRSALAALDESMELNPNPEQIGRATYLKGVLQLKLNMRADATQALTEAVETHAFDSVDANFRLAAIYLWTKDLEKAIAYAGKALDAEITEEEIVMTLGGHSKAVSAVNRFLSNVRYALVQGYFRAERWRLCIVQCTRLIEKDPSYVRAIAVRGHARKALRRWDEALEDCEEYLRLVREDTQVEDLRDTRKQMVDLKKELEELVQ